MKENGSLHADAISMPTVVRENNDSLCLGSLETKSDTYKIVRSNTTPCEYIPYEEERAIDDENDAPYPIENIDDELSDTDSLETIVYMKPIDKMSDSETSNTVIHLEPDQRMSDRDTCSLASDSDDASIYTATDDELSDSDTLDFVSDIEFDDDIVDIKESDDDIVNIKEIDNDIVDIEAIALQDQDEVDITAARNDIADTSFNDNDMFDDDDNLFGILDVYIGSDLHFDLSKIPVAVKPDLTEDFGYKFFSFSTFFK